MLQQLRAFTERVNATAPRAAVSVLSPLGFMGTDIATTSAWNIKPSVHATAICTHGKRYEWRLQERLT
jgi:hypothetical protein